MLGVVVDAIGRDHRLNGVPGGSSVFVWAANLGTAAEAICRRRR